MEGLIIGGLGDIARRQEKLAKKRKLRTLARLEALRPPKGRPVQS